MTDLENLENLQKDKIILCEKCNTVHKVNDKCAEKEEKEEIKEKPKNEIKKKKKRKSDLSQHKIDIKYRQAEALKLRVQGYQFSEIADKLGFANQSCAYACIRRAINSVIKESATELITLSTLQLETMMQTWQDKAATDTKAAKLLLDIIKEKNKLLGITKEQVEVTHKIEKIEVEWDNNAIEAIETDAEDIEDAEEIGEDE